MKSKPALLILIWNFCITLLLTSWLEPVYYTTIVFDDFNYSLGLIVPIFCCLSAALYLFYPLTGYLAAVKCGRYRTLICSLCFMPWGIILSGGLLTFLAIFNSLHLWIKAVFWITLAVVLIMFIALLTCHTAVSANIIQFGMDQLYDSPMEESALFIIWFVFTSYLGFAIFKLGWIETAGSFLLYTSLLSALLILVVSLCVAQCKRQSWFLIDPGSRNPYKMVYRVIRFAMQHKAPVHRSAFTYCEDELPTRIDLGKEKYGGPFSTEQVEDVKAFLGILCLLLTLGPIFSSDIARNSLMYGFSIHLEGDLSEDCYNDTNHTTCIVGESASYFNDQFNLGILTELLTAIFIPLYVCLFRPFYETFVPRILRKMGQAMILLLLSLISLLLIDVALHILQPHKECFLSSNLFSTSTPVSNSDHVSLKWFVVLPHVFNALGYAFFYPSVYSFICSQSPHAMKGMFVGSFFAIKGIFQFIGVLISLPFHKWNKPTFDVSCGSLYFLSNVLFSLIGLVAYICVARKYQYRRRDEPDNIYRYAEEYYDRSFTSESA